MSDPLAILKNNSISAYPFNIAINNYSLLEKIIKYNPKLFDERFFYDSTIMLFNNKGVVSEKNPENDTEKLIVLTYHKFNMKFYNDMFQDFKSICGLDAYEELSSIVAQEVYLEIEEIYKTLQPNSTICWNTIVTTNSIEFDEEGRQYYTFLARFGVYNND